MLIGGGIGALTNPDDRLSGALMGGALGGGGAALGGLLAPAAGAAEVTAGMALPEMAKAELAAEGARMAPKEISKSIFNKGFMDKITVGLQDAAPLGMAALTAQPPDPVIAPAAQLSRPEFTPAENLFIRLQRRRR